MVYHQKMGTVNTERDDIMNVNLVGAVGGGNFGDELILNCCLAEYSTLNDTNISISGFGSKFFIKNDVKINSNGLNFFVALRKLSQVKLENKEIKLQDLECVFAGYDKIDIIHFIGGGYINSIWKENYALVAIAYIYSMMKNSLIYATGISLHPHSEDSKITSLINSLDFVDVRDLDSEIILSRASYTGDDALLAYRKINISSKQKGPPALIISLQNHLFDGKKIINEIFNLDLLKKLNAKNIKSIVIIEAAPEDNIKFPREFYNLAFDQGFNITFLSGRDILREGLPYNNNSFVISTRYHINLLYSMLNVTGVSVYQNEYYEKKHKSIVDMGGNWPIASTEELSIILNEWLEGSYLPKVKDNRMSNLSAKKTALFSHIKNNTLSLTNDKMSIDNALSIINKYIN